MTRGERTYLIIKAAGDEGVTTADIQRKTGLMDAGKAVQEARKEWCSRGEIIADAWDKKTFFGFFPRKQKRYFYTSSKRN